MANNRGGYKEALGRFNAVPSIDFDMADAPDIPVFNPDATRMPEIQTDPTYNPFDLSVGDSETPTTPTSWGTRPSKANTQLDDWESLYENFTRKRSEGLEEARSSAINSLDFGLTDETYIRWRHRAMPWNLRYLAMKMMCLRS